MNYNVSTFDSKSRLDIRDDIAHALQSDSSESLRRSSSSDYLDDRDCREKMQAIIDKRLNDGRGTSRINLRTGDSTDSDPNPYCHRVVKSISFNECFSNNPGTSEHIVPGTITHTLSEDAYRCDETNAGPCQTSNVTNIIQTHSIELCGTALKGSSCYNLGEKAIDDIITKFSPPETPADVPSTSLSTLQNRGATLDKKRLTQMINDLETEKLDGEKKLLDMKLTMLTLQKEKDTLNEEFMSLQEQFLAQQVTDNGKTTLEKRVIQLEKVNLQAEKELDSVRSGMMSVRTEKECLQKKLADLEEYLEEHKETNDKLIREREKGRNRVEEANTWVESLREWKNKAVADMEITKNNVAKFSELVKQNDSHLKTVRARNKKLRKKLKRASVLMKEAKSRRQSMENEISELKSQLDQFRNEMDEKSSEVERSQMDLFETRDMNDALQKRLENVAESKFNHIRQSNDLIESLGKELNELKVRMENSTDENRRELELWEKNIDSERTMRNFMIISYRTLEEDYNTLFKSALDFRQVMTAVVQGTTFASGI